MIETSQRNGPDLAAVRGIIWDLDNTLYRIDAMMSVAFNHAVATTALSFGVDLSLEAAVRLAEESFQQCGFSSQLFVDRYKLDWWVFYEAYHYVLDETIIERSQETIALFAKLPASHVMLTHGPRVWAEKVVAHLGLAPWFPADRILALEDYEFRYKHDDEAGFRKAQALLALPEDSILVVEDTLRNLSVPHALGMATAYVTQGRSGECPAFVDLSFPSAPAVLAALGRATRRSGGVAA